MVVVLPDKCLFTDDDGKMESKKKADSPYIINQVNTIETERRRSIVPAQVPFDQYPSVIFAECGDKKIFKEEYDLTDLPYETTYQISIENLANKKQLFTEEPVPARHRRSDKVCSKSKCGTLMWAQCTEASCSSSYCVYKSEERGTMQVSWEHIYQNGYFCLPCCFKSPQYWRMPTCRRIQTEYSMCSWYDTHGRCGEDF